MGTNTLVDRNLGTIQSLLDQPKEGRIPPFWDGAATGRILDIIA